MQPTEQALTRTAVIHPVPAQIGGVPLDGRDAPFVGWARVPRPSESSRQLSLFDARRAPRAANVSSRAPARRRALRPPRRARAPHGARQPLDHGLVPPRPAGEIHYRVHHMFLEAPARGRGRPRRLRRAARAARRRAGARRGRGSTPYVPQHRARIAMPRADRLHPRGRVPRPPGDLRPRERGPLRGADRGADRLGTGRGRGGAGAP